MSYKIITNLFKDSIILRKTIFFSFLILISETIFAEKTDIVILNNGDKITGEIKEMEFAQLKYSTDGMNTIKIDWDDIVYLKSKASFRIEAEGEAYYYGSFDTDTLSRKLIIIGITAKYELDFDEVVRIYSIEDVFLERFKVNLSIGFNFTKASEIAQFNLIGNISYRGWKDHYQLKYNNVITAEKDTTPSQNFDVNLSTERFFENNWYAKGFIGFQRNTKLGLDSRLLAGFGGGKDIIRTNRSIFNGGIGYQGTRETSIDGVEGEFSTEGIVFLGFNHVSNNEPEINFSSELQVFPNFSTKGRTRVEFSTNLKWEIVSDLYWELIFYDHYDSKPISEDSVTNDYGIIFSLGWSL